MNKKLLSIFLLFYSVGIFGQQNFVLNFFDSYFDAPHSKIKLDTPLDTAKSIFVANGYQFYNTVGEQIYFYKNIKEVTTGSECFIRCNKENNTIEKIEWCGWYDTIYFKTPEQFADNICEQFNSFGLESWYCFNTKYKSSYDVGFKLSNSVFLYVYVYNGYCHYTFTHHSDWKPENPYETDYSKHSSDELGIYQRAEKMPEYPGGMKALVEFARSKSKELYPEEAKKLGLEGTVVIRFVINKTGAITQPIIVKSPDPVFNNAAIEIVKAIPSDFTPGEIAGRKVSVYFYLPILFTLDK